MIMVICTIILNLFMSPNPWLFTLLCPGLMLLKKWKFVCRISLGKTCLLVFTIMMNRLLSIILRIILKEL